MRPDFTHNFEALLVSGGRPVTGVDHSDSMMYVRHLGAEEEGDNAGGVAGVAGDVALLALADMPPPAVMPLFDTPAPIRYVALKTLCCHCVCVLPM